MIYVVDSSDRDRLEETRRKFMEIINDEQMKDALILVFANKQDIKTALDPTDLFAEMNLGMVKDRSLYVSSYLCRATVFLFAHLILLLIQLCTTMCRDEWRWFGRGIDVVVV